MASEISVWGKSIAANHAEARLPEAAIWVAIPVQKSVGIIYNDESLGSGISKMIYKDLQRGSTRYGGSRKYIPDMGMSLEVGCHHRVS